MIDLFLFRQAIRDLLRPKKIVLSLVMILLPALVALLWRLGAGADFRVEVAYNLLCALLVFGFILVIQTVVFSTGVIAQEIEQKTITYLLIRPIARWRIALAKYLAAVVVITVSVWLSCALLALTTYGFSGMRPSPLLKTSQIKDPQSLLKKLKETNDMLSFHLGTNLRRRTQEALEKYDPEKPPAPELVQSVVGSLNRLMVKESLYEKQRFEEVVLPAETQALLAANPRGEAALARLNRALLEAAYPKEITRADQPLNQLRRDFLVLPVGVLAYSALFLLVATLVARPLIFGMLFAFGWESWVPSLRGNFEKMSLMAYLRVLAPHEQPDAGLGGAGQALIAFNPATITPKLAWTVLSGVFLVALALALLVFSIREYTPREDIA
jgi:ABC-type transport system involved in multi-copper enzyme maturation permease subunit